MEAVNHLVSQYGYFGIFSLLLLGVLGLPVPDETLLAFAGFLVSRQQLHPVPTLLAAFLGSICGITISYGIGRTLGFYLIHRYGSALHITQDRIDRVHDWFGRVGTWGLLIGYFIPGVRHLTAMAAGTSGLRPVAFAAFAYSGACIWVLTFVSVGYFVGEEWKRVLTQLKGHLGMTAWILAVLLAVYLLARHWANRTRKSPF